MTMTTEINENDLIHKKERKYFVLAAIISIFTYISLIVSGVGIIFIAIFSLLSLFAHGIMLGYIRSNGVRINHEQFPEVFKMVVELSRSMNLFSVPDVYVLNSGGVLNAYATRFFGRNMVVLYSEIFELIERDAKEELSFIIAHELAHIKRRHISKQMVILPSMWIPFLGEAYSRACEYTCDRYATHYIQNPDAAKNSLTILAVGKELYKHVNQDQYLKQIEEEKGFFVWLSEKVSTHPTLPKRIHEIEVFTKGTSPVSLKNRTGFKILAGILVGFLVLGGIGFGGYYVVDKVVSSDVLASFFSMENPPLIQAVVDGDNGKVEELIQQGVDVNEQDVDGFTALHWAISDGDVQVVNVLLDAGANPNITNFIKKSTPLTNAISFGEPEMVKLLIDHGADVNVQGIYGQTPLMEAVQYAYSDDEEKIGLEMVQILLNAGADPSIEDDDSWTALQYALDNGHKEITKVLREHGRK